MIGLSSKKIDPRFERDRRNVVPIRFPLGQNRLGLENKKEMLKIMQKEKKKNGQIGMIYAFKFPSKRQNAFSCKRFVYKGNTV